MRSFSNATKKYPSIDYLSPYVADSFSITRNSCSHSTPAILPAMQIIRHNAAYSCRICKSINVLLQALIFCANIARAYPSKIQIFLCHIAIIQFHMPCLTSTWNVHGVKSATCRINSKNFSSTFPYYTRRQNKMSNTSNTIKTLRRPTRRHKLDEGNLKESHPSSRTLGNS